MTHALQYLAGASLVARGLHRTYQKPIDISPFWKGTLVSGENINKLWTTPWQFKQRCKCSDNKIGNKMLVDTICAYNYNLSNDINTVIIKLVIKCWWILYVHISSGNFSCIWGPFVLLKPRKPRYLTSDILLYLYCTGSDRTLIAGERRGQSLAGESPPAWDSERADVHASSNRCELSCYCKQMEDMHESYAWQQNLNYV